MLEIMGDLLRGISRVLYINGRAYSKVGVALLGNILIKYRVCFGIRRKKGDTP
jgi:hypothetical protein